MPVSPEQRKILLERLEMARQAKAQKQDAPKTERKKTNPPPPPQPPVEPSIPPPAIEKPAAETSPMPEATHAPQESKNKKMQKNKYMKVVFYSEPGRKKVENLLASLDNDASEPIPVTVSPPKQKKKSEPKKTATKKPKEDDSLDMLAKLYFS